MTRLLYSFFMWLAQPWLRRKLASRAVQEPGYLQAVPERFGHYIQAPLATPSHIIWVHAVSLGETRAATVLVAGLRQQIPGMRLLLTHGTATGRAEAAQLLQDGDIQVWQPWDTMSAVRRFLRHFKPRIGILMETEVWPNLVAGCVQMDVPLVLANARMSEKSMRKARRLAWLADPAFGALTAIWAQTSADAGRLTQLGARVAGVFGNLKFDATPNPDQLAKGRAWRAAVGRPVVMFASSRAGEEQALLEILAELRVSKPVDHVSEAIVSTEDRVQWLIVPRHPQRFDQVAALIGMQGFRVSRRSAWSDAPLTGDGFASDTIWLGDSLGEMALYYGLADVALLGGSFEPLGGQNLIEAAACGCPVLMGQHTFNFADAAELAQAVGAALRLPGLRPAVDAACNLVNDPASRQAMVSAAGRFSAEHRGALEKTVGALIALLRQQGIDAL